jgi:hypothetical protein
MKLAHRVLKYIDNRSISEIIISISAPLQAEGSWYCEWSIGWPHGVRTARAYGVDGVQALRLTLEMIGSELYSSPYHSSGNLYFETLHRGYGFPVPANMRDVLIGDDKSLF